jgi:dynein heavy chain 1
LKFFLEIFGAVLYNTALNSVKEYAARLSIITKDLFQVTYNRVARGMLHQDHITFAVLISRIRLKSSSRYVPLQ